MSERDVLRAVGEAQAIEEAFRQILRANFPAARRALADAQRDHFGMKPYQPGFPALDAVGDQIVYKDENGFRFVVKNEQPNGAHIRVILDHRRFEAWGFDWNEASRLGLAYAARSPVTPKYTDSYARDGFVVLRYEDDRAPLD